MRGALHAVPLPISTACARAQALYEGMRVSRHGSSNFIFGCKELAGACEGYILQRWERASGRQGQSGRQVVRAVFASPAGPGRRMARDVHRACACPAPPPQQPAQQGLTVAASAGAVVAQAVAPAGVAAAPASPAGQAHAGKHAGAWGPWGAAGPELLEGLEWEEEEDGGACNSSSESEEEEDTGGGWPVGWDQEDDGTASNGEEGSSSEEDAEEGLKKALAGLGLPHRALKVEEGRAMAADTSGTAALAAPASMAGPAGLGAGPTVAAAAAGAAAAASPGQRSSRGHGLGVVDSLGKYMGSYNSIHRLSAAEAGVLHGAGGRKALDLQVQVDGRVVQVGGQVQVVGGRGGWGPWGGEGMVLGRGGQNGRWGWKVQRDSGHAPGKQVGDA